MSFQTNNPHWKSGYAGNQSPYGASAQEVADHQRGAQQRAAEEQKKYEEAWKRKS